MATGTVGKGLIRTIFSNPWVTLAIGAAAGYYGYLWSLVYAQDMFSVFEKNGVMDKTTGLKYRDVILSNGGSQDEFEMVIEFLGREPNQDAFFRSIGLESIKETSETP